MNPPAGLESAYRRLLRWYPKAFRFEYESELLGVLMAAAGADRLRPTWREKLNLMTQGIWTRLRPTVPRSARTVRTAVALMYAGALVDAVGVAVLLATTGSMKSRIMTAHPDFTVADWHTLMAVEIVPHAVAGGLAIAFWVVAAWANGQGRDWGRRAFALYFCLASLAVLFVLTVGGAVYATAATAIALVLWTLGLVIVLLIFNRRSEPYYWRMRDQADASGSRRPAESQSA
jgi:hypothetical protein